jgi:hypothetical protein
LFFVVLLINRRDTIIIFTDRPFILTKYSLANEPLKLTITIKLSYAQLPELRAEYCKLVVN